MGQISIVYIKPNYHLFLGRRHRHSSHPEIALLTDEREGSGACEQFFHLFLTLLALLEFAAGEMLKKKKRGSMV